MTGHRAYSYNSASQSSSPESPEIMKHAFMPLLKTRLGWPIGNFEKFIGAILPLQRAASRGEIVSRDLLAGHDAILFSMLRTEESRDAGLNISVLRYLSSIRTDA